MASPTTPPTPMDDDRAGWPVALGFILSLLLHAGAGVLLVRADVRMSGVETETAQRPKRESPRIIELGEPDSDATTITWIGYTEYEEHLARKSETEQALQTPDDTPVEPIRPDETVALAPAEPAPEKAPPEATTPDETTTDEPETALAQIDEPTEETPAPTESSSEPVIRNAPPEEPGEDPIVLAPDEALIVEEAVGPPDDAIEQDEPAPETKDEEPSPVPVPTPETSTPADRPEPPRQAETTNETADEPADEAAPQASEPSRAQPVTQPAAVPADREAVATAIKHADEYDPGKPLASKGLRIRTVRPELSHYTALFARYRAPVARIFFGRDGRVVDVVLLRNSGDEDVDRNTLDALFRWRAEGELLEQLEPMTDPPPPNRTIRGDDLAVGEFTRLGRRTVAIDIEILP